MAHEVLVVLAVVLPDEPPDSHARIRDLHGRELPGVPGSWVSRVAVLTRGPDGAATPVTAGQPLAPAGDAPPAGVGHDQDTADAGVARMVHDELEHQLDLDFGVADSDD